MKYIYILFLGICSSFIFSQSPQLINYQGLVRKANGTPLTAAPLKIKFEIFPQLSGGTAAFTEIQSVTSNTLGLFSTQIGKTTGSINVSWGASQWFLEVYVDTTNTGTSFISLGRQQMVSVPYALYAEKAGSAPPQSLQLNGNALGISGGNTVTLPSSPSYTTGTGLSITSGSVINNTAPDQTVSITPSGNAQVTSAYPNFTVNVNPQTLGIISNSITLSNGGGTIVLPATSTTPNTSLTATGIASVSSSGTNTFNIAVPSPTITGAGATTVSGTYPNFTISSPTIAPAITPTISGTGVANVSPLSGNNFTVNVPAPALSLNANILTITQGTASSVVTFPPPATTSITGAGIATVTPLSGNNFTVNVAPLNLTGTGATTVTGTYPNLTINTPTPPTPPAAWLALGNAGTIDGTHFLGTSDNVPLNFRTNNQKSGRIDPLLSNAFFGYWAGRDNTTGSQNTALGTNALLNNTTGSSNVAIGVAALSSNITGTNNTALGHSVLFSNTGSGNTGAGYYALNSNTTGSLNAAYGSYALINNTTGYYNTALGGEALRSNTNGFANTSVGYQAMYWNNGNYNSGFGHGVLQNNSSGIQNTGLGSLAGYNNNGSGNVFIGYAAGYNSTASNQLYIANNTGSIPLIFGDFSFGTIGLGTTSPASKLHMVDGSAKLTIESINAGASLSSVDLKTPNAGTASLYKFNTGRLALASGGAYNMQFLNSIGGSFQFDEGANTRLYIAPGGNVGINTLSPVAKLHVNGNVAITDGTQADGKVLTSDAAGNASWQPATVLTTIPFNGKIISSLGTTPVQMPILGSFTKNLTSTKVQVIVQTHIHVSDLVATNSVMFEVRLNGNQPVSNTGRVHYFKDNNNTFNVPDYQSVTIIAEFPTLSAGSYNVEIWVNAVNAGGTASNATVDSGNFGASNIIIKEYK